MCIHTVQNTALELFLRSHPLPTRQIGQQVQGIHLSPLPQAWLLTFVLRLEFRSSCLGGNHFTDYAC